jgi:pentatricopeptide repeat protein
MEANFHNGSSSYPFYRWSRRGVALVLVMMVHLSVVADGFVPTAMTHMTRSFSGTSFVSMYATVERTTRASNAFGEEDDDNEEDDEDIEDDEVDLMVNVHDENFILAMKRPSTATSKTESQRRRQKKQKTQNPAMHDTQFLRKRTNDLLAATEAESTSQNVLLGRRFKVDRKTFHFLLDAWAFSNEIDASHQAQRLLSRMEEIGGTVTPDVRSYTKTINAIARSGEIDAGEQAEAILEKMKRLYKESLTTNPELASSVKPNSYTYTAVIQAHAGSGAPGSAQKAHALIKKAIEKNQRGDDDVKPTCKAFLAVISAYGKAGDATSAETIFRKMERTFQSGIRDCKPNVYTYNALISAYANCEGTEAKAAEVLAQLESLYETTRDPDLQPTTVSYNAVIDAYAKAGEPNAAEEILRRMETFDIRSNTRSFNSVLNAWAKSRDPDAALHAEDLFELMNQLYHKGNPDVRPDLHSYCTVINGMYHCIHTVIILPFVLTNSLFG